MASINVDSLSESEMNDLLKSLNDKGFAVFKNKEDFLSKETIIDFSPLEGISENWEKARRAILVIADFLTDNTTKVNRRVYERSNSGRTLGYEDIKVCCFAKKVPVEKVDRYRRICRRLLRYIVAESKVKKEEKS